MADCRLPKAITSKMKEEGKKRLATDWLNVNFLCGMKRTGHSWMENWKIKISDRSEILIEIMFTQYNRKLESIDCKDVSLKKAIVGEISKNCNIFD